MASLTRILITIVLVLGSSTISLSDDPGSIAVFVSHNADPYEKVINGFQEYFHDKGVQTDFHVYDLHGETATAKRALDQARSEGAALLFTIGTLATEEVISETHDLPVVAGLVLRKDRFAGENNLTGVVLEHSFEVQFEWLKRLLPSTRSVGILFSPDENTQEVLAAEEAARKMGIRLETRKVRLPNELPKALESLEDTAEVLLGIPDRLVLAPQMAKQLLLFSFRQRIPFVGISGAWVKAGALYSLDWNYEDIGKQCSEIALQLIEGARAASIPWATPRKVEFQLNLRTADHMKADIPQTLVRLATQVY